MDSSNPDPMGEAIELVRMTLAAGTDFNAEAMERLEYITDRRSEGLSYRQIVTSEPRPLVVEMLRERVAALLEAAKVFQRSQARTLYEEGLTMEEIADAFGISRPRVSALLRSAGVPPGGRRSSS